jgi:hypothetical protein
MKELQLPASFLQLLDIYTVLYNLHNFFSKNGVVLTFSKLSTFLPQHESPKKNADKILMISTLCPTLIAVTSISDGTTLPSSLHDFNINVPDILSGKV